MPSGSAAAAASPRGGQPCGKVRGSVLVSICCRHGQPPKKASCAENLASALLSASEVPFMSAEATALPGGQKWDILVFGREASSQGHGELALCRVGALGRAMSGLSLQVIQAGLCGAGL